MSKDQFIVTSKYRTNSLHEKGNGSTITVHYTHGSSKVYEHIQHPKSYIKKIKEGKDYLAGDIKSIVINEGVEHHIDNTDLPF